jgi:hemerythrin-like domain-containing protein
MAKSTTTKRKRTTSPAARRKANGGRKPPGRENALSLLRSDHEVVSALFDRYEKGRERMSPSQKAQLVQEICKELKIHTTIEEEIFYPAVREHVESAEDMLEEATVEHASAKDLIAQLEEADAEDELYDAKVKVLGEYVRHHVKEEQNELFPEVRGSELDLTILGEQLKQRKSELAQAAEG